ncbi:MAG: hypothetical protein LBF79_00130 [Dysgonamonadaceae bacterium]|nr:hypothetical protein [Dysgonamonadaceae bacterium]
MSRYWNNSLHAGVVVRRGRSYTPYKAIKTTSHCVDGFSFQPIGGIKSSHRFAVIKKISSGRLQRLLQVGKSLWGDCSNCCKSEKVSETIAAAAEIKKISSGRLQHLLQVGKTLRDVCRNCGKQEKVSGAFAATAEIKKNSPGRLPQLRKAGKFLWRVFAITIMS